MNIKDYLQQHKGSLAFDENLDDVWLGIEKDLPRNSTMNIWWVIGILVIGSLFFALHIHSKKSLRQDEEIQNKSKYKQHEIFAVLQSKQSGEKILAVSQLNDQAVDDEVIDALIYTLQYDESINVKIATVRALEQYMQHEKVRIAIIEMLGTVNDSYLKIKLIHLLTRKKIKHAIPALDDLIQRNDTRAIVREEATTGKEKLISI